MRNQEEVEKAIKHFAEASMVGEVRFPGEFVANWKAMRRMAEVLAWACGKSDPEFDQMIAACDAVDRRRTQ